MLNHYEGKISVIKYYNFKLTNYIGEVVSNSLKIKTVVGVPVYNEEKHLPQTLNSLIAQNVDDVSFIIADNCSTDRSWQIINDLCGDDKRFIIHQHDTNKGAYYNFKYTLDLLDSEYFMWLGAHDFISDGYLAGMVETLDSDTGLSMAFGIPNKILDDLDEGRFRDAIHKFPEQRLERYLQATKKITYCAMYHSLFRKKLISDFDFKMTFGSDFVMICHLLWFGNIRYVEGHKYSARFFSNRTGTEIERVTGNDDLYLSRHDFIKYQLDTFDRLYRGDTRMKTYIHNDIINSLQGKWGIQSLILDDGR